MESIRCVRLVTNEPVDLDRLVTEFPTVTVELANACGVCDAIVDCEGWLAAPSFAPFDRAIAETESVRLSVRGPCKTIAEVACEVLTRYQRHVGRRNELSATPLFDAVLRAHAGLHDARLQKPLVAADWDHALDTWQWMLRLDAHASLAAQLAALFHDVERLESEADARIEHRAPDYQAFKDAHAKVGARRAQAILAAAGVDAATAALVRSIIESHERRGTDAEVGLLNDADALSFFSLNSSGYLDYFGPEQTARKVAYTLGRMSPRARAKLALARLRPDVQHVLLETDRAA